MGIKNGNKKILRTRQSQNHHPVSNIANHTQDRKESRENRDQQNKLILSNLLRIHATRISSLSLAEKQSVEITKLFG